MNAVSELKNWLPDEKTAALVTAPLSVRYLCGTRTDSAIMLVFREEAVLFASERELAHISERIPDGITARPVCGSKDLLDVLVKYGIKHLLIEPDKMTFSDYMLFRESLHYSEIHHTDELTEELSRLRSVKSDDEISYMTTAQRMCDKTFERLVSGLRKGMTERQIAALSEFYLTDSGSEGIPIPTVVLSGENTLNFKKRPCDRAIAEGDLLILEFGATYKGYCAKMCRTIAVGKISEALEESYHAVSCAISDGLRALRPDTGGKVADSVMRSTLNAWNLDRFCVGTFAKGIGLEPTELPYLGQESSALLRKNMTLSVNCGISVDTVNAKYGIKISDMAALTEEGCVNFTVSTKNLIHI